MSYKNQIRDISCEIPHENLSDFTEYILNKYAKEFFTAPSSINFHHCKEGGNLEHTINVLKIVHQGCNNYRGVNEPIVTAGAILHDIGKIKCYSYKKGVVISHISNPLHGHFIEGNKILEDAFKENPIISKSQFDDIQNIILSHHGPVRNGFGSIVDPIIPESFLVYYADTLDAFMSNIDEGPAF